MWQSCPLCKGTGYDPTPGTYSGLPQCPICKGQRIISEITGKPPAQGLDESEIDWKYQEQEIKKYATKIKDKIPIYKGCPNQQCYCTGACREIIGYRDKLPGEH